MIRNTIVSIVLLASFIVFAVFIAPQPTASAACVDTGGFLSFPRWYQYLEVDSDCNVSIITYSDGKPNIGATAGAILLAVTEILLRVAGIVAIGFIIYGGILYTISQGQPDRITAAQKTLLNGVIGLVIAVLAVSIVNLVSAIVM